MFVAGTSVLVAVGDSAVFVAGTAVGASAVGEADSSVASDVALASGAAVVGGSSVATTTTAVGVEGRLALLEREITIPKIRAKARTPTAMTATISSLPISRRCCID